MNNSWTQETEANLCGQEQASARMYACVLIPKSLSLVLQLHPNPANLLEMSAAVWSNLHLTPGTLLHPDEGELRLDRLEVYGVLRDDDIRRKYGCYDVIHEVDGQKVRHCNWIRFVKASSDSDKVNIISSIVKGHPFFQVIKPIKPNDELVVLFHDDTSETSTSCHQVTQVMMSSPSRHSPPDRSHRGKETDGSSDTAEEEDDKDSSTETSNQSSCHQLVRSEERSSRQLQDVSNDESARWDTDMQVSSGEEDSVSSPQEADKDIPQSSETVDPHQHSDNDQCSQREDRVTSCEGFEVAPCSLVSTTTPIPEVPSRLLADSAPTHRGRERTWWPCDTCPKKFDRPSLLKRHIRTHTGEKPHACDVCGKAFSTSSSLNTHRRIHSGEKPHQCPVCGKRFTASSNLYYHRMTHNKEKPHKCQLCSKSFPTPGDLRSHMYIHNGSWPFHCDVCNRGFSKHTNLRNHMLLHTGDKPHECSTCGKRFALQCNLKAHLKTHVGEKSSSCTKCGQAFSDNLKMASEGLCSGCSEDSTKSSSQKGKEQVTIDSKTDFSIAKLTARSPRASKDKAPSPGATSISSASSRESTSPPCGQFNGHRPWLSPFSSTSSSSLTSPPAMSCVMTSVPSLPHYVFLDGKSATSPSVFFAQDMTSREAFMPSARASLPYPTASPWKQQMIAHAF